MSSPASLYRRVELRRAYTVVGDKLSGATALVTAAFDDPLASDGDVSLALASRRLGDAPEVVTLT